MSALAWSLAAAFALTALAAAQAPGVLAPASTPTPAPITTPAAGGIPVLHVQKNVYMLVTPSGNVTVQVGSDGVLVVDTGAAADAARVLATIKALSNKPIHTIVNTHLHAAQTGGNETLVKMGGGGPQPVRVMAHENVFNKLMAAAVAANANVPANTLPMNAYFTPRRDFFLNGEAIVLVHAPRAHTDGDTIVHFRGSDVVSTGDLFSPDLYPTIDLANGGTVNGVIAALNQILEITIPAKYQEGGTYVIPGRGRLCDEAEVVEYRDMVTIVRDRVQDLVKKGMTLEQVKAARPTSDYDLEYGADSGAWTTAMFVEAVYRTLENK